MALPEALRLEIDYAQLRVQQDAQTVLAQGSYEGVRGRAHGWEPRFLSADCWVDPVTYTLMLRPGPAYTAWSTTTTGIYARLATGSLTFGTPGNWRASAHTASGDHWHEGDGFTANETVVTNTTWAVNQPMWLAWFTPNTDVAEYIVLDCGWSSSDDLTAGVGLRIYSSGKCEVWKGGVMQAEYSVSGGQAADSKGQQFNGIMLIPCRKRELLVVTRGGDGFSHAFTDLDESDDEPTITPAEQFFVRFPYQSATRSAKFQLAQLQFGSSGTAVSTLLAFPDAPKEDQGDVSFRTFADLYSQTVTPSLVEEDGSTAFVVDDLAPLRKCRVKVSLSGSGTRTPFVYGVQAKFSGYMTDTADETYDLVPWVTEAVLHVGETADSVSLGFTVGRTETADADAVAVRGSALDLRYGTNRPLKAVLGTQCLVMGGRTGPPRWNAAAYTDAGFVVLEARDRWKALETYILRDVVPLDGLTLREAIEILCGPVFGDDPDRYDIDPAADDFTIPKNASQTAGEWTALVEPGDRAAEWLKRLFDSYAPDWFYGFVPTVDKTVFRAGSVEWLGGEPAVTLYSTAEEAIAALVGEGMSSEEAAKHQRSAVYSTYREQRIDPEATEVRVTGWDPRTATPVQRYRVDSEAEDPTLASADRPDNWVGEKRPYGWVDSTINSAALAERCVGKLYPKLTKTRVMAEWESGLLQKSDLSLVWRGDVVRLDGIGDFRVTSISCAFVKEPGDDPEDGHGSWVWRPATYTGELIAEDLSEDAYRGSFPVAGLDNIAVAAARMTADLVRAARGSEWILKRVAGDSDEAP